MSFEEQLAELANGQQRFTNGINHLLEVQSGMAERQAKNDEAISRLTNGLNHLSEVQAKNETLMTQVIEALARLANTAAAHEERIGHLEER